MQSFQNENEIKIAIKCLENELVEAQKEFEKEDFSSFLAGCGGCLTLLAMLLSGILILGIIFIIMGKGNGNTGDLGIIIPILIFGIIGKIWKSDYKQKIISFKKKEETIRQKIDEHYKLLQNFKTEKSTIFAHSSKHTSLNLNALIDIQLNKSSQNIGSCQTEEYTQNEEIKEMTEFQSPCESPIEEQFWKIAQHEISGIVPQYHIGRYRVDFALPDKHVIIELDGHEYHKTKKQRTADARRERNLQELGWRVIRFTGTEIYQDAQDCVEQVKRLIA